MNDRLPFGSQTLKYIAALTMLTDHLGYALFPYASWMRCIGRIAFPLYCFMLSEGAAHTSSRPGYMLRLLIAAIISEIPYDMMISGKAFDMGHQNVILTLALGLAAIWAYDALGGIKRFYISLPAAALAIAAAALIKSDYGWYGAATVFIFYLFRQNRLYQVFAFTLLVYIIHFPSDINMFALLAALPICLYNGRPPVRRMRYAFYLYYPVHMLIIALIAMHIG